MRSEDRYWRVILIIAGVANVVWVGFLLVCASAVGQWLFREYGG